MDLGEAIVTFFTSTVPLPDCPLGLTGKVWWEEDEAWLCPWRIVQYIDGCAEGYPCGEPKKILNE
jgi:hypothetical protein